jgi:hypothetical protein
MPDPRMSVVWTSKPNRVGELDAYFATPQFSLPILSGQVEQFCRDPRRPPFPRFPYGPCVQLRGTDVVTSLAGSTSRLRDPEGLRYDSNLQNPVSPDMVS